MSKPVRGIVQGPDFQPKHDMVLLDSPLPNRKWVTVLVRSEGKVGEFEPWMVSWLKYHWLANEPEAPASMPEEFWNLTSEEIDQKIAAAIAGLFEGDRS